jgi:hypothetical protein
MAAVAALQMKSVETGRDRTSLREINAAIAAERKGRKR